MTRRSRCGLAGLTVAALLVIPASPVSAAVYRASFSGKQQLSWTVDGVTGGCETRRGRGDGTVSFTVRSSKAVALYGGGRRGLSLQGSIPSVATGSITGRFTDAVETPCPGFEPRDAVTDPADGCGPTRFGIRVDLTTRGTSTYVVGPSTPLGPVSVARAAGGPCPFPIDTSLVESSDLTACGDGTQLWRRSWGVTSSAGRGLLASRIHVGSGKLPRKGRARRLTGRAAVDCTVPSSYSGGVKLTGSLTYTLTIRRVR